MNIEATVIKDSVNPDGQRLTSFIVKYPRFIHAEHLRHRMHSFNSASSRAIPAKKMRETILAEPALPEWWGKNQSGMQAEAQLEGSALDVVEDEWQAMLDDAVGAHQTMEEAGLHKQIANRILEPWMHITVLVSGTDWENFFSLRAHPAAQPEFQVLAYRMLDQYLKSQPQELGWGQWHIPFEDRMPEGIDLNTKLKIATARAARLSYLTFEGEIDLEKDIALHDSLVKNGHMSPTEHCAFAYPSAFSECDSASLFQAKAQVFNMLIRSGLAGWEADEVPGRRQGNFSGFTQYRKLIPGENRTNVDLKALLAAKPDWVKL